MHNRPAVPLSSYSRLVCPWIEACGIQRGQHTRPRQRETLDGSHSRLWNRGPGLAKQRGVPTPRHAITATTQSQGTSPGSAVTLHGCGLSSPHVCPEAARPEVPRVGLAARGASDRRAHGKSANRTAPARDCPPRRAADRLLSVPARATAVKCPARASPCPRSATPGTTTASRGRSDSPASQAPTGCPTPLARTGEGVREIEGKDFFLGTNPVTKSFWAHVMGRPHPCCHTGPLLRLENVS
jgi:hypothetical protein